jgi:glycosyltransferase involved in cell wall biosynthesis
MQTKILFIHLYNNFTGSPNILSNIIVEFENNYETYLVTDEDSEGFLSNLPTRYDYYQKTKVRNSLFKWFIHQVKLFLKVRKYKSEEVVIYCNTMYSIGAGIAGYLYGKNVIYHIHEVTVKSRIFKYLLVTIINKTASKNIVVSEYLKDSIPQLRNTIVINNTLGRNFQNEILPKIETDKFTILMLSSLQKGKGIEMFMALAKILPKYIFELVVSISETQLKEFLQGKEISDNLYVYAAQENIHLFYSRAKLLLNLSNPNTIVETFGMTILEAMNYEIPAIVPNVGGPLTLIQNGINGYCIDVSDIQLIKEYILKIAEDDKLYQDLAENASIASKKYQLDRMIEKVISVLK